MTVVFDWVIHHCRDSPIFFVDGVKQDDNTTQKFLAAQNSTSGDELTILAKDELYVIRQLVADNPTTPLKTLAQLATDEDHRVRYCAARNSSATDFIQRVYLMTEAKEKNATRN